jgi:hypothetical protein
LTLQRRGLARSWNKQGLAARQAVLGRGDLGSAEKRRREVRAQARFVD